VSETEGIEWRVTPGLSPYAETLAAMEARAAAIRAGEARELVWLLEHPPLYTAGTSADPAECSIRSAFRSTPPGAAGATPITGPGSGSATSSLDLDGAAATSGASSTRSKAG
jgi:lipoyl(octanoyl) transferase